MLLLTVLAMTGNAFATETDYTVNATTDTGSGSGTSGDLRYVLTQAESTSDNVITFSVMGTITLTAALPAITQTTTITGPGANVLTISGGSAYQIFNITAGTVAISGLTIANGKTSGDGAGIANAATLTVTNCFFSGGSAVHGAGISSIGSALTVIGSTFLKDSVSDNGGAIYSNGGTAEIYNDTFVASSATNQGGGVFSAAGNLVVVNSTFDSNAAGNGGAIGTGGGNLYAVNNIFDGDSGSDADIFNGGTVTTESNNLFSDSASAAANFGLSGSDSPATDPKLLPLENYGGPTPTMLPLPGSIAIHGGTSLWPDGLTAPGTDQRGFTLNSSSQDIGAVQTNYVEITSTGATGADTLYEELSLLNSSSMVDIDMSLANGTVTLTNSLAPITGQVNIIGPGASKLAVSGNNSSSVGSVFTVNSGANALFYGLTIENGMTTGPGGGIYSSGTLSVIDSAISGNSGSSNGSANGGGIYSTGPLTIIGSTVSGNTATSVTPAHGGGIYSTAALTIVNSTLSGNTSNGGGEGLYSTGTASLTNVTVSGNGNSGISTGGGGIFNSGTLTLANTIVEGNASESGTDQDMDGSYTDAHGNVVNIGTTAVSASLDALGNYSGTTGVQLQTMLPLPGSTAICAGSRTAAVDQYGLSLTTDERGYSFGTSSYCTAGTQVDAGAVQTDYTAFTLNDSDFSAIAGTNVAYPSAPTITVTENGNNVVGVPLAFTLSPTPTTATGTTATTGSTGATFGSLQVSPAGTYGMSATTSVGTATFVNGATLNIYNAVSLPTATLTAGSVGTAYTSAAVTATGGTGTYTYSATGLPAWATINTSSNAWTITGTPTAVVTNAAFTVTATDSDGFTGSQNYTITINKATPSLTVSGTPSPSYVGQSVTFTATLSPAVTGLTGDVSFSLDGAAIAACSGANAVSLTISGSSGVASCTVSNLAYSSTAHTITTSYPGDTNYGAANSTPFAQTVNLNTTTTVLSPATASTVNQSVTFTATVTDTTGTGAPSAGTVNFTSGSVTIPNCGAEPLTSPTGKSAVATCTTSSLDASSGGYSIGAAYTGDAATYGGSTATAITQTVGLASTSTTVSSPGAVGVNQTVTLTATVSPFSGAVALSSSGTVLFKDNGTAITGCTAQPITASTGQATCSTSFSSTAGQSITAYYNGDSNYSATVAGAATALPLTAGKATTAVAVSSLDTTTAGAADTSNVDDSVTFTASVTPYSGTTPLTSPFTGAATVGGTVSFTSNGSVLCASAPVSLTSGNYVATCTTSALGAGSRSIVATYSGDGNYNGSVNNLTQTVNSIASATTLSSSAGATSSVNQSVTFTANVTPIGKAVGLTGSVSFTDNGSALSCAPSFNVATGVATCTVANLPLGANSIAATYAGDSNYTTSNAAFTQTVGQAGTTLALVSTANPATVNESVTFTATVTTAISGSTALSGTVTFMDGATSICSGAVNPGTGVATCSTATLALGTHAITATYGNDANFSGSTGNVSEVVNAAGTSVTVSSSVGGSGSTVDQTVAFTATVAGASGATKYSGTMVFTDNGSPISGCSIPVNTSTGVAVCSTGALTAGSHTVTATYTGDPNFATGNSSVTQKVGVAATTLALTSSLDPSVVLNPQNANDLVNLVAAVSPSGGAVPFSGSVTFTDNGAPIAECQAAVPVNPSTGIAACPTKSLGSGAHTILAAYNSDANYTASSSSITQTVQDYTLATSATSTVTVTQGYTNSSDPFTPQTVTVSATPIAGFTGNLTLSCSVVAVTVPSGAVPPTCSLADSSLAIASGTTPQPIAITIDAGAGSTPRATPGDYTIAVTGVDAATGLTRITASVPVQVQFQASPLTLVSGATSGNTVTLSFTLPANVGLASLQCSSVSGPTLTSSVAPIALGMSCDFNPTSVPSAGAAQSASITVTVNTDTKETAQLNAGNSTLVMAGLVGGMPILLLLWLVPGCKSSRKALWRLMGVALAVVVLLQGMGCAGGSFTAPPAVSGVTPPGSYNILVQGTGTDHQVYQAVIQVNVTR